MKISGITFVHNGVEYDYCFAEAIWSMLGCCDEVVVVEAESTDGTMDELLKIQAAAKTLKIVRAKWNPAPLVQSTNTDWTMDMANLARESASNPYVLYVQADEVIHERAYPQVRESASRGGTYYLRRLNFWIDPWHLVPPGRVCGHHVCRLGPRTVPVIWGSEHLACSGAVHADIDLFHYGFIRDGAAFRKKSEIMHKNFMGVIDPIVYEAEKHGIEALRNAWPESELKNFNGSHPLVAKPWLNRHGFDV